MSLGEFNLSKIAKSIEQAINSALTMDPSAQKHLHRLKGCILALEVTSTNHTFYFGVKAPQSDQDRYLVELLSEQDSSTVHIAGSILALVKLAASKDKALLFRTREISLSGDSVRIQQVHAFLESISIDWEAILANFIGDVPAHFLGSTLRTSLSWGLSFSQSILRDAEEYIKYELRLFPNKHVAQKQFAAIDELHEASEKLANRFQDLVRRTNKNKASKEIDTRA